MFFHRYSSILIHILVILLIITAGHVVHPFLVVEIPLHGLLDTFLELETGFPTEFALELAGVDGIAHVVALAVGDVGDEVEVFAFLASEQAVDGLDDYLDDVDVLPLVEASDVVGLGYLAVVEYHVDGTGMVFNIESVAHVLAFAVHWQWLAVTDVVDEKGNQLLGELIGSIIVRAVGDDGWHAVGVVERTDEVVAACLGC